MPDGNKQRMVIFTWRELQELDPENHLLKLVTFVGHWKFKTTDEFWERYPLGTHPDNMDIEYEYTRLLNIATYELSHRNSHRRHLPE